MFKSYLKIAFRSLQKNRLTTFINIFGLGLSMSVGLMILIRTQDALSYDKFHPSPERTYRVTSEYNKKSGERWQMASTPLPLNSVLLREKNIVEDAVNIYPALNGKAMANNKELNGINPGELDLRVDSMKGASTFGFEYTEDPPTEESVWVKTMCSTSRCTIKNLQPGKKYWFRTFVIGSKGQMVMGETLLSPYVQ